MRRPAFVCVVLALATLAVYWPVHGYDYVNYDDAEYVAANRHVLGGLRWANIVWAFTVSYASNWHPLTWLSHMLDCQLFGQKAGAQHLVSVGFHVVNTFLVFLVLRRMTGAHWRSAFVAALFGLHPLHVESVAWISERKDVLSTCFFLLTLAAYAAYVSRVEGRENKAGEEPEARHPMRVRPLKADRAKARGRNWEKTIERGVSDAALTARVRSDSARAPQARRHASRFYVLAVLCFTLGLMSKPMLVTLPFLLLLLDFWPLGRLGLKAEDSRRKALSSLVIEKLPFFVLSLASSVVTYLVQRKGGSVSTMLSLGGRLANALVSYARYIGKTIWPVDLSVLYPHPGHWPVWQVAGSAALLLGVSAAVFWLNRGTRRPGKVPRYELAWSRPWLVVGWLWFMGTLVPVIGLVQVGVQSMADRYSYVSAIGLWVMVAWGAGEAALGVNWRVRTLAVGAWLSLAACAGLTTHQVRFWRDGGALFQHAVEVTSRNYLAYNNLGYYLASKGKAEEAMRCYRQSLEINPVYEEALNNVGYALAGEKKFLEAIGYYEAALRIQPNHAEVHNNLGNALSELGRIPEAITHYEVTLRQKPDHADAHNNLGIALAMQGKVEEAMNHFREAVRLKPDYASAHSNYGNALMLQHQLEEAIKEFETSLRLDPKEAKAHNNIGNALVELGKLDEAIGHYQQALELNADNPEAHYNLGLVLARQGKKEEAVAHYIEALRLKPDYAEVRDQLNKIQAR